MSGCHVYFVRSFCVELFLYTLNTRTFRLLNFSSVERSDLSTSLSSVSYFSLTLLTRASAALSISSRDAVVSSSNLMMTNSISCTGRTEDTEVSKNCVHNFCENTYLHFYKEGGSSLLCSNKLLSVHNSPCLSPVSAGLLNPFLWRVSSLLVS